MAQPTTPITRAAFRYKPAAKTDVAATIEAERKRIGALTGRQVRERRKAATSDAQPEHALDGLVSYETVRVVRLGKIKPRNAAP